jgi:hypothetical protein
MKYQYKTVVDTGTLKGLKRLERLIRKGWKVISVGYCTVLIEKRG